VDVVALVAKTCAIGFELDRGNSGRWPDEEQESGIWFGNRKATEFVKRRIWLTHRKYQVNMISRKGRFPVSADLRPQSGYYQLSENGIGKRLSSKKSVSLGSRGMGESAE
jgi:hypothetical protein